MRCNQVGDLVASFPMTAAVTQLPELTSEQRPRRRMMVLKRRCSATIRRPPTMHHTLLSSSSRPYTKARSTTLSRGLELNSLSHARLSSAFPRLLCRPL